ncbi:hypothetical protein CJJ18_06235 [Candidatus Williamhamiltonella defendens]|uniref:Uncharacterized protein n=2 Tax=Candidatus Williamhamiltonella defendens TaxID=138072 RepID=A0AAC9VMP4_9ENTR|nr:hypothetical protein [Candidatus Hamiltonella defensa]ASV33677.1 hypothetical protein CJJ18_06235 [Candidatus Hamiltonella defensa]AWK16634.1 hypothetical protein CCS40_06075 [Candidatus Hamiltonella defensa]
MGMECRLTKYTNATNGSVFTDKSVNEASLSDGKSKSGVKKLFRQSLKLLRNTFKMVPKIKTKKGSYSLSDDKSNKMTSIPKPAENYFNNDDKGSNILRNTYNEPIFASRRDSLKKSEEKTAEPIYEEPSNLRENGETQPTEASTRTPLTENEIKKLYEEGFYASVDKTKKAPEPQNTMSESASPSEGPPPVPPKNEALKQELLRKKLDFLSDSKR